MNFVDRAKNILLHPNSCWSEIGEEKGIKGTLQYLFILTPLSAALWFIINLISLRFVTAEKLQVSSIAKLASILNLSIEATLLIEAVSIFFLCFSSTFLVSALTHLFMKMFKGKGAYAETYKAIGYSVTPSFLLVGIPFVNQFTALYMTYLQMLGLSKLHKVSIWKAMWANLLTYITLLILIFVPLIIFIFSKTGLSFLGQMVSNSSILP